MKEYISFKDRCEKMISMSSFGRKKKVRLEGLPSSSLGASGLVASGTEGATSLLHLRLGRSIFKEKVRGDTSVGIC